MKTFFKILKISLASFEKKITLFLNVLFFFRFRFDF